MLHNNGELYADIILGPKATTFNKIERKKMLLSSIQGKH